jgi:hypothetical protein
MFRAYSRNIQGMSNIRGTFQATFREQDVRAASQGRGLEGNPGKPSRRDPNVAGLHKYVETSRHKPEYITTTGVEMLPIVVETLKAE